jgi:cytochrome c553
MVFGRILAIATRSKNEKSAIEAAKLLKAFADGEFREKAIEGQVKKLSDEEIAKKLEKLAGDD